MQLRPSLALAVALVLSGCVDQLDTATTRQDVIGGTPTAEGAYPGVGALYLGSFGGAMCTGTLIAPDVVLTAAHCVDPFFIGGEIPGFTLAHDTRTGTPTVVAGASATQHPSFDLTSNPAPGVTTWYDIAVLFLAEPITSVDPIPLPSPEEATMLAAGGEVALVGYGQTTAASDSIGIKFDALASLVAVGTTELQISSSGQPQNCHGDSGGPALIDLGNGQRVVGVVSRSADLGPDCVAGGIDTRVDAYLDFIAQTAPTVCVPPDCVIDPPDEDGGCCSTSGGDPAGALVLAITLGLVLGRRRRSTTDD
jgi:uncharacterized protein (TIGR03382 family)